MIDKIRLRVARFLDFLYPSACWAVLVMWALVYQKRNETFGIEGDWRNQTCRFKYGNLSYCGKCANSGLYWSMK